jgi:outer membrane protein
LPSFNYYKKIAISVVVGVLFCLASLAFAADNNRPRPDKPLSMSLPEAILLAVRDNTDIQNAYLQRVVQKFQLKVSEHKFKPNIDLTGSLRTSDARNRRRDGTVVELTDTISTVGRAGATLTEKIPTGAEFTFTWEYARTSGNTHQTEDREEDSTASTWRAAVKQPLLRGAGIDVNMASVRQARLTEQQNILGLKSTLIGTVTTTITTYRSYVQAVQQVKIARQSLVRAQQLLEQNKTMIAAGRMARTDLVQSLSNVANQKIAYQQSINSRDQNRLSLLKILRMDKKTKLKPVEKFREPKRHPTWEESLALAYANQPIYLGDKITVESSKQNLVLAENGKLWDLSLNLHYNSSDTRRSVQDDTREHDWSAGLVLSIPLYGETQLSLEQALVSARSTLLQSQNSLSQSEENMKIDIDNALRTVEINREQVALNRQALKYAREKLANEQEKLKFGKSTNFQVVSYQTDLSTAENSLLSAEVSYLNSLVDLDQILGTTLDTWKIDFKTQRPVAEKMVMDD